MIRSIARRKRPRTSKTVTRLEGWALSNLRLEAFNRSGGTCELQRGHNRCREPITWENSEMAHIQGRGAGGADVISNVQMSCKWRLDRQPGCHALSHNAGGKPCPKKTAQ